MIRYMLLTGRRMERVTLATPKGIRLELEVKEISIGPDAVSCAIEKDSGDDPDVSTSACSLMGSTIPVVPRMEMPPSIPSRGLKVFFASASPSGTEERIGSHLRVRAGESMEAEAVLFSKAYGELSRTAGAGDLLQKVVCVKG